jgi:predicted RNA-binding protein with PIN domain
MMKGGYFFVSLLLNLAGLGPAPCMSIITSSWQFKTRNAVVARAKKKKPSNDADSSSSEEPNRQTAGRVLPVRGSVRAQIKMVAQLKKLEEQEAKASTPARKTKFRRSKDEALDSVNYRKSGDGDPDRTIWVPGANMAYGTWVLLVDGYNIVGASERLSSLKNRESLDAARTALIEDVVQLASMRGWRIELVFDSYMTGRAGSRDPSAGSDLVNTVFTGSRESADSYIEKTSYALSSSTGSTSESYAVATNDKAIINAVTSHGGVTMSSDRFLVELSSARYEAGFIASSAASRQNRVANMISSASRKDYDEKDEVSRLKRARAAAKATNAALNSAATGAAPVRFTNFIELPFDLSKKVNAKIRAETKMEEEMKASKAEAKAAEIKTASVNKARESFRGKASSGKGDLMEAKNQKKQSKEKNRSVNEIDSLTAFAAASGLPAPKWEIDRPGAASGSTTFTAIVTVGEIVSIGEGGTKAEAKTAAARAALREASGNDLSLALVIKECA